MDEEGVYRIKLMRENPTNAPWPYNMMNVHVSYEDWSVVYEALEVLKKHNKTFSYEAWYAGKEVVAHGMGQS
jgi:predicted neuraminidase